MPSAEKEETYWASIGTVFNVKTTTATIIQTLDISKGDFVHNLNRNEDVPLTGTCKGVPHDSR